MAKRITKLSREQEALLPAVRDEWLAHGLSTEKADRTAAEAGVRAAYEVAGLEPPPIIVWLGSPFAGALGQAALRHRLRELAATHAQVDAQVYDQVYAQVHAQVHDQVDAQVYAQVHAQVYDQVDAQVRAQVHDQVRAQVRAQVHAQVYDQVYDQVDDQVDAQVRAQVRAQVYDQVRAQVGDDLIGWWRGRIGSALWAGYYAYFDMMQRAGVQGLEPIAPAQQVAKSAGWWWCFRGAALITDRPALLERDDEGRLHCETGPAIAYRDGWAVYAWHGVRLDPAERHIIEDPARITITEIHEQRNAEIKRVMLGRYGWERYLHDSGAKQLQSDDYGVLWRAEVPGDPEPLVMVEVQNSTPEPSGEFRRYTLRVPPSCRTAREAVAWTFDVPADEYEPVVQT